MLCCRRISVIGTPASPCFRMLTIWLSVNRDFRMGISLAPESLPSNCLPGGEAYVPNRRVSPHEHPSQIYLPFRPPSSSPHRWCSATKAQGDENARHGAAAYHEHSLDSRKPVPLPLLDPLPFGSLPATMNAASCSQPARGVIVAPLIEFHPDRIVVGSCTLLLRDGKRCTYAVGTPLEVAYTEVDGRRDVDSIT